MTSGLPETGFETGNRFQNTKTGSQFFKSGSPISDNRRCRQLTPLASDRAYALQQPSLSSVVVSWSSSVTGGTTEEGGGVIREPHLAS